MSARPARSRAEAAVKRRTRSLRRHDCHHFRAWVGVPIALWPDGAIRSFCRGVPVLEDGIDADAPIASDVARAMRRYLESKPQ